MKKFSLFLFLLFWRFIMADDPTPAPAPAPTLPPELLGAFAKADADYAASDEADAAEREASDKMLAAQTAHDDAIAKEADAHQKAAQSANAALTLVKQYLRLTAG